MRFVIPPSRGVLFSEGSIYVVKKPECIREAMMRLHRLVAKK